jgi:hypothetical protein
VGASLGGVGTIGPANLTLKSMPFAMLNAAGTLLEEPLFM